MHLTRALGAAPAMRNPKYPLQPLCEHRDHAVEGATSRLGGAVRTREAAGEQRRRAEQAQVEAEARAAQVREEEARRLAGGELKVADLGRASQWEHAAAAEMADLGRALARADETLAAARGAEAGARAALAQSKADLDVVVKDQARFDAGVRRAREASEEEAADDAFAARRREA